MGNDKRPIWSSKGYIYLSVYLDLDIFQREEKVLINHKFSKVNALRKRRGGKAVPLFQQGEFSLLFLICICLCTLEGKHREKHHKLYIIEDKIITTFFI